MIAVNLSRQQALDPDPRKIQQIYITQATQESISFWKNQKKLNLISHKAL